MNRRLGKRQKYVLVRMNTGWELGLNLAFHGNPWLQEGGCGRGGKADHTISASVVLSLYEKKLIKVAYRHFPLEGYELTKLGTETIETIRKEEQENEMPKA